MPRGPQGPFQRRRWDGRALRDLGVDEVDVEIDPEVERWWRETSNGKQVVQLERSAQGSDKWVIRPQDAESKTAHSVIETGMSNTLARLSPDGTRLMVTSHAEAKLYDVVSGHEILSFRYPTPTFGQSRQPADGLWSADGTQFWYALDSKGKLVGFDARPLPEPKP